MFACLDNQVETEIAFMSMQWIGVRTSDSREHHEGLHDCFF